MFRTIKDYWKTDMIVKQLLGKHFSKEALETNANFFVSERLLTPENREASAKSNVALEHLQDKNGPNPFTILASHMYQMYERKLEDLSRTSNLEFEYRHLGGVQFNEEFADRLRGKIIECGDTKYAGFTFLADPGNATLNYYTQNGGILIGSDIHPNESSLDVLERSSLAFVAHRWVYYAIIHVNSLNTYLCSEKLKLYTWTRTFNGKWDERDTLVARNFRHLKIYLERKICKGFCNMSSNIPCLFRFAKVEPESGETSQVTTAKKTVVINLGLKKGFHFDCYLLAWAFILNERNQDEFDVKVYFNNTSVSARKLQEKMRDREATDYNKRFEKSPPAEKFSLQEVPWQFAVSAIVPVETDVKITDEMTLYIKNTERSIQLLGACAGNGQQVYEFATRLLHEMESDEVEKRLREWWNLPVEESGQVTPQEGPSN